MAIMHHVMDEALDKVIERLQLQLKQPFKKAEVGTIGTCPAKGGTTATTSTGIRGEYYGDSYREDCQDGK